MDARIEEFHACIFDFVSQSPQDKIPVSMNNNRQAFSSFIKKLPLKIVKICKLNFNAKKFFF